MILITCKADVHLGMADSPGMSHQRTSIKYMFDTDLASPTVASHGAEPPRMPLERLEAQICELAGHLAAATCQFLVLLADFDARRG